jgi:multidrug efflux pump subunit AcrA (membrane-fusion protein)
VTIIVGRRPSAIVLPRGAVVDATATAKVYVVDADDIVRVRPITVVRWPSVNAIVETGLKAGDRVVLEPGSTTPGARIRPVTPTSGG